MQSDKWNIKMKHRRAVGPTESFDKIGALQFCLLTQSGLREYHKLLDFGCGSLRGGRFFIVYLNQYNYYGIDPFPDLIQKGINEELGQSAIELKKPHFKYNSDFNLEVFGDVKFDFILAQSIFSHCARWQIEKVLHYIPFVMKPNGKFIATFKPSRITDYKGDKWTGGPGKKTADYKTGTMKRIVENSGLSVHIEEWPHPHGQKWMTITI